MAKVKKQDFLPRIPRPKLEDVLPKFRYSNWPKDRYECPRCGGSGRVVCPGEEPDPVEGHKLSARMDCPFCEGKGHVAVDYYKEVLKNKIEEWKKIEPLRKEQQEKLKNAVSKLTDDELEIIESFVRRGRDGWPSRFDLSMLVKKD